MKTKSNKSEEQLLKEIIGWKNRYESAIISSGSILYDWDSKSNHVTYGGALKKILGYSVDELAGDIQKWVDLIHPDDQAYFNEKIQHLINTKESIEFGYRIRRKDGNYIYIEDAGQFIEESQGEITRMIGFVKDITDRREAEEKLRKTEEYVRKILDISPAIICVANVKSGYFTDVNPTMIKKLGFSAEEITSRPLIEFVHPEDLQKTEEEINEQIEGHEVTYFENRYLCKDGSYVWLGWQATEADKDGKVYAVATDITDRKQAEEALLESNEEYLNLLDSLDTGVVLHAPDTSIIFSNPKASEILGISPDQMKGKQAIDPQWRFVRNDGTDMPLEEYPVNKAFRLIKPFSEYFIGIKRPDRKYITWVDVNASLVFDKNNNIKCVTISFNDNTEQKQAEESLHKYEHIVSSSTDMLAFMDKQYTYLAANKEYMKAFDLTTEKLIGKTVGEVFGKKFFNSVIKPHADSCLGGEEVNYQDWFDFPSTGKRYMDITYYPYYAVDKQILGFVVNGRDITDRKQAEEELKKHREHLEELVLERTAELETKNKELDNAMKVFVGRERKIHELEKRIKILGGQV